MTIFSNKSVFVFHSSWIYLLLDQRNSEYHRHEVLLGYRGTTSWSIGRVSLRQYRPWLQTKWAMHGNVLHSWRWFLPISHGWHKLQDNWALLPLHLWQQSTTINKDTFSYVFHRPSTKPRIYFLNVAESMHGVCYYPKEVSWSLAYIALFDIRIMQKQYSSRIISDKNVAHALHFYERICLSTFYSVKICDWCEV